MIVANYLSKFRKDTQIEIFSIELLEFDRSIYMATICNCCPINISDKTKELKILKKKTFNAA